MQCYQLLGALPGTSIPALLVHVDHDAVSVQCVMDTVSDALSIILTGYHMPLAALLPKLLIAAGMLPACAC